MSKKKYPPLFEEIIAHDISLDTFKKALLGRKVIPLSHLKKLRELKRRRVELINAAEKLLMGDPKGKNHA